MFSRNRNPLTTAKYWWTAHRVAEARSVDRCVTTLRAKIETDPHHPSCIQTIRDIGYRFEV
ncbi:MAG TPA: helix-turn-helix domain-containing protein [Verrucomicrobiae bacterium]